MKNILFLFLLLFYCYSTCNAQTPFNTSSIDAKLIVGFWESADSNKYRIEFVDEGWAVKLKAGVGVAGGYFFTKDSLGRMLLSGWAPNWPPFNCGLYLSTTDTLLVDTWYLGSDVFRSKYVRVKE